jgi:hypothetical protein
MSKVVNHVRFICIQKSSKPHFRIWTRECSVTSRELTAPQLSITESGPLTDRKRPA